MKMRINLVEQRYNKHLLYRQVTRQDTSALGRLFYDGYKDTIDYEGETEGQFITEIENTLEGKYGPFLFQCSFLIELDQQVAATTFINLFRGVPLLSYTVTRPNYINKGYSTFLIKKSMDALYALGF